MEEEKTDKEPWRSSRVKKPVIKEFMVSSYFVGEEFAMAAAAADVDEPLTFSEAMASPEAERWKEAMDAEYQSLVDNDTWELVPLPPGRKAITSKWLFKVKQNSDGEIDRFKARLVARGFTQQEGIDYQETFSPVVKFQTIRAILAVAAAKDLELQQMDFSTAFLNGVLEEELFMAQPKGYERGGKNLVCRLKKSIYGLKQASRAWNQVVNAFFEEHGFSRSNADSCVYVKAEKDMILIIAIYVDDLILASNDLEALNNLKNLLMKNFKMKDLGELKFFLGMEISRDRQAKKIYLSQQRYLKDILRRFGMQDCKAVVTPLEDGLKLSKELPLGTEKGEEEPVDGIYRSIIGSLMYAMIATRPDIAYAVGLLSRFMVNPGKRHLECAKRVLRYLRGTISLSLEFSGDLLLKGFSDADWAGCPDERKSTSGFVFYLGNGAISWKSSRQTTVALSSTEAEYIALCTAAREGIWLRRLL